MTVGAATRGPGMDCPECKTFIPIPITSLLARVPITCTHCGIVLTLDAGSSEQALALLQRVQDAADALERR